MVWKKPFVPGPSGPSSVCFIRIMPVHVDYQYFQRNPVVFKIFYELLEFMFGICPPP